MNAYIQWAQWYTTAMIKAQVIRQTQHNIIAMVREASLFMCQGGRHSRERARKTGVAV